MNWISIGLKFLPLVVGAVHAVEALAGAAKGKDKQDAAVMTVGVMLQAVGDPAAPLTPEIEDATRKLIDAYVAVQNAVAAVRPIAGAIAAH